MIDLEQFEYIEKLGNGTFGDVYQVIEKKSGREFAAKVDRKDVGKSFYDESDMVKKFKDTVGFPQIHFTGEQIVSKEKKQVIVMQLLGESL